MPKGLIVDVFRNAHQGDTTAGGPSSMVRSFVMMGPHVPEVHMDTESAPIVLLSFKDGYPRLTPASLQDRRPAFGGNFAWSGDSRWTEIMVANGFSDYLGPIKIFDHVIK